jgi:hypothetical protein
MHAHSLYVGIDPGASGAICVLPDKVRKPEDVLILRMPDNDQELLDYFEWVAGHQCQAVVEQVGGYAGSAHPGSRMFKFGMNYGAVRMALAARGIPYECKVPRVWQSYLSIPPRDKKGGETDPMFKRRLRAKAQQLFPKVKVTLQNCDAILLAEYCRRLFR